MIIKRTLKKAGYGHHKFDEAESASNALPGIKGNPPDLILCDWNMPGMSGLELISTLRNDGNKVKFGFITSESTEERRQQAKDAGALFLVSKPFTPQSLQLVLDPIMA